MLETESLTQKEDGQVAPVNHEVNDDVNNVSNTIYNNDNESSNYDEASISENYEVHVDSILVNDVVVSKKYANKCKKKEEEKEGYTEG